MPRQNLQPEFEVKCCRGFPLTRVTLYSYNGQVRFLELLWQRQCCYRSAVLCLPLSLSNRFDPSGVLFLEEGFRWCHCRDNIMFTVKYGIVSEEAIIADFSVLRRSLEHL